MMVDDEVGEQVMAKIVDLGYMLLIMVRAHRTSRKEWNYVLESGLSHVLNIYSLERLKRVMESLKNSDLCNFQSSVIIVVR